MDALPATGLDRHADSSLEAPTWRSALAAAVGVLAGLAFYAAFVFSFAIRPGGEIAHYSVAAVTGAWLGLVFRNRSLGLLVSGFTGIFGWFLGATPHIEPAFFYATQSAAAMIAFLATGPVSSRFRRLGIYVLLAVIVLNFLVSANLNAKSAFKVASKEPVVESYRHDPHFIIRLFYLMKEGKDFYPAFTQAHIEDARFDLPPTSVWAYREPTLYRLWALLLPGSGLALFYGFQAASVVVLLAAFLLARRFTDEGFALLAPLFAATYLLFPLMTLWFTQAEYWGGFVAILAVLCYVYQEEPAAAALALLAAAIREWYVLLVLLGLFSALLSKDSRRMLVWGISATAWAAIYAIHLTSVMPLLRGGPLADTETKWLNGGLGFVAKTMRFGTQAFAYSRWAHYAVFAFAALGALLVPDRSRKLLLVGVLVLPPLLFLFVGAVWDDYWGPIFMTFALGYAPWFFHWLARASGTPHFFYLPERD